MRIARIAVIYLMVLPVLASGAAPALSAVQGATEISALGGEADTGATAGLGARTLVAEATATRPLQWEACSKSRVSTDRIAACEQLVVGGGLGKLDLATVYRWLGDAIRAHTYAMRNDPAVAKPLKDRVWKAYDKSIKLNPRDPETYDRRASLYESFEIEKAVADYSKAIELGTTDTSTYVLRAQYYQRQGKLDLAIADMTGAIKLRPSGYYYLDRALLHYKMGTYEKALADLDAALEADPSRSDVAKIYHLRGLVRNAMGDPKEALADFAKSDEKVGASIMLRYRRGLAYSDAGETGKAIDDFTYVIETGLKTQGIINDFVEDRSIPYGDLVGLGYAGRALALIKSDRLDEALTDAERGVKINANHAGILQVRGAVHEMLGNRQEAIADYRKVLTMNPSSETSRNGLERLNAAN